MTLLNIIAVVVIAISCGTIIFVRLHKLKKNNVTITVDTIIEEYGDEIINILQDFIKIMQIDINDYPTKEDYIADLISLCVDAIQDNYGLYGVDSSILKFVDSEQLAVCVANVLESNKIKCFSILSSEEIGNNEKYFDEDVVEMLAPVVEGYVDEEEFNEVPIIDDFSSINEFVAVETTTDFEPYNVTIAEETESYVVAETPTAEILSCETTSNDSIVESVEDASVVKTNESISVLESEVAYAEEAEEIDIRSDASIEAERIITSADNSVEELPNEE